MLENILHLMFVVISISMHKTKPEGIGVTTLTSPMGIQENNLLGEIKGIYGVKCWSLQKDSFIFSLLEIIFKVGFSLVNVISHKEQFRSHCLDYENTSEKVFINSG